MEKLNKKILFFGTDDVSASALNALLAIKANIVGIVSKPDRPSGRHKKILFSQIKQIALANNIPLFQPEKLSLMVEEILATKPDLILTCSYGKIIPKEILYYPKYKCLNIHPSLLPKYRGAAPIQYAILNGEKTTGLSLYIMTPELDAGPIVKQIEFSIDPKETGKSLREKVKKCIYECITTTIFTLFEKSINEKFVHCMMNLLLILQLMASILRFIMPKLINKLQLISINVAKLLISLQLVLKLLPKILLLLLRRFIFQEKNQL